MTFPNGVFSGTIISSVTHNGSIKSTAEWQLLLGAIALPGESTPPDRAAPRVPRLWDLLGLGYLADAVGLVWVRVYGC